LTFVSATHELYQASSPTTANLVTALFILCFLLNPFAKFFVRDLRFSRRWRFKSRSSGLWGHVVMWWKWRQQGPPIFGILPQHYTASQPRRPRPHFK